MTITTVETSEFPAMEFKSILGQMLLFFLLNTFGIRNKKIIVRILKKVPHCCTMTLNIINCDDEKVRYFFSKIKIHNKKAHYSSFYNNQKPYFKETTESSTIIIPSLLGILRGKNHTQQQSNMGLSSSLNTKNYEESQQCIICSSPVEFNYTCLSVSCI